MIAAGFINGHIRHLRQCSFKTCLAVGVHQGALLVILYADRVKVSIRFSTGYIIFITAHFKDQYFKWCNKDIVPLHIATSCTVNYIIPMIAILSDRRFL